MKTGLRAMRVILAFRRYCVGDIITPTGLYRDWLKARGYIAEMEPETHVAPVLDATEQPPARRKRGRPRKA